MHRIRSDADDMRRHNPDEPSKAALEELQSPTQKKSSNDLFSGGVAGFNTIEVRAHTSFTALADARV